MFVEKERLKKLEYIDSQISVLAINNDYSVLVLQSLILKFLI